MSKRQKTKKAGKKKSPLWLFILQCMAAAVILSIVGTYIVMWVTEEETVTQYPQPTSYFFINDYSKVLSEDTESYIQAQAVTLYEKTKAQIVVVMVPDTQADDLEEYSYSLANKWGIGDAKLDNGVLLLFTTDEPHVRMEVGKGLEGCLNDAKAGRILDDWAVDAKDDECWNEAAINTWVATAHVVYGEYGITPPDDMKTVESVSEALESGTMADADVPEALTVKNEEPLADRIIVAFMTMWSVCFFPFLIICFNIRTDGFGLSGGSGSSGGWYSGGGDSGGGGYSGGGGSFGGGGASR